MKKKYILAQFALVFVFFILPPLFVSEGVPAAAAGTVSWQVALQAVVALLLETGHQALRDDGKKAGGAAAFAAVSWGTMTLGLLMLTFAATQAAAMLIPSLPESSAELMPPQSASGWALAVLSFAVAAFYEEVLYRQFMPLSLLSLLGTSRPARIFSEASCVVLFALSHRYLGWPAVANAAVCGAILRLAWKKTSSVYAGTAAHLSYNLIVLVFSALIRP